MLTTIFQALDSHTHVATQGQRVPTAGININADLPFNGTNATLLRSARFSSQSSPIAGQADLACAYVSGGDLYYNNASGTPIQITSGSGLSAASVGGITGMGGTTAAVTYNSATGTFTFTQNTNRAGLLDAGSVTIRYPGATSQNGITLQSPASVAAPYSLTLFSALPASTKIVTVSSGGLLAAAYDVDNTTLEVNANALRVKAGSLTNAHISGSANIVGTQLSPTANIQGTQLTLKAVDASHIADKTITVAQIHDATLTNVVQNFGTPSAPTDVAIKSYVDARPKGPDFGANVNAAGTIQTNYFDYTGKSMTITHLAQGVYRFTRDGGNAQAPSYLFVTPKVNGGGCSVNYSTYYVDIHTYDTSGEADIAFCFWGMV